MVTNKTLRNENKLNFLMLKNKNEKDTIFIIN
jgi:hypothetical protein